MLLSMQGLLGPDSKVLNDILAALWSGLLSQMKAGKARDAGGDAFSECLAWALSQVLCCINLSVNGTIAMLVYKGTLSSLHAHDNVCS